MDFGFAPSARPGMTAAMVASFEYAAGRNRRAARLMPDLRIYGVARTRAFRALWVAKELGIPYEHIPIEIGDAGARTPEFLAINPNGRLPVVVDGGFVLFESLAITLYLAKKHSPGRLYPGTLEGEARAWQWSFWAISEVDRGVNIWSLHAVRLPEAERDAAKREEALKVLAAPFKVLDAALAGTPYLLGDSFTVADLNVAAVISRAVDMDLSAVPSLKAWLGRCLERPAAREALALKSEADRETPADVTRRIARTNRL
jgi:glutathione S-transferase